MLKRVNTYTITTYSLNEHRTLIMNNQDFYPDFHALRKIKVVNGVEFKAIHRHVYQYILDLIQNQGNGDSVAFNYDFLATEMGMNKKTVRQATDAILAMGLISACKGRHSHLTFKAEVMPWEIKGLSEEDSEGIQKGWKEVYS